MNIYAALFSLTKDDWINSWKKLKLLNDEGYDHSSYLDDENQLKNLSKNKHTYRDRDKYEELKRRMEKYQKPNKMIGEIKAFLNSKYFIAICDSFNLDVEAVRAEFDKERLKIFNE